MPEDHADVTAEAREHLSLYDNTNRLKLGTFATNASYGSSISEAPTSYHVSWQHTVGLAQQAEQLGLDMVVPIGRWRGFGGTTNFNGESFETYTWAAGIAQATERVMVFATSHVPTIHPIVAAKQAVTIDHISNGRFGLNLVMGWFKPEMEMFGSALREHDERYSVGDEWVRIVKQLWTDEEPVSFDGRFYTINGAESWPKPIQRPHPVIMNAGSSPAGSDFAARNADINFVTVDDAEVAAALVQKLKANARDNYGRDPQVFSGAYVVCRDTEKEARDAVQSVLDHGDRQAARNLMEVLGVQSGSFDHLMKKGMEDRFITGWGAPAFVGTPEQIADQFIGLEKAGISGITMGFLDYAAELEYFGETVLPLLREAGLRA
ncbi:monooxygenase [Mycobacterium sp. djl-10]|nr:monooxygenase [Mycobacterium sp. djl-10]